MIPKERALVISRETSQYRRVAQLHWGLTDEQMVGMHVHHEPPRSLGGRNIPEHLYVCSPEMHQEGWHHGASFPKLASEGGRLSANIRRQLAKERAKMPKEERQRLKIEKEVKRRKNIEHRLRVKKALEEYEARKPKLLSESELLALQQEMVENGLLLPDPAGLVL